MILPAPEVCIDEAITVQFLDQFLFQKCHILKQKIKTRMPFYYLAKRVIQELGWRMPTDAGRYVAQVPLSRGPTHGSYPVSKMPVRSRPVGLCRLNKGQESRRTQKLVLPHVIAAFLNIGSRSHVTLSTTQDLLSMMSQCIVGSQ